jgi:argininosuccinate lyase
MAAEKGMHLDQMSLQDWKQFHSAFQGSIQADVSLKKSVNAKLSWGGTALKRVSAEIQRQRQRLFRKK